MLVGACEQESRKDDELISQAQIQGFEWAHPNIYPTDELLECMEGPVFYRPKATGYPGHRATTGFLSGVQ